MKHLLALLAAVLVIGCKSSTSSDNTPQNNHIMPLKIGNWWQYKTTRYDETGSVIRIQEGKITVVKDTLIEGETWFVITDDAGDLYNYITNRADGLYYYGETDTTEVKQPIRDLPFPATIGAINVKTYDIGYQIIRDTVRVQRINISVTTPAGTFNCIHFGGGTPLPGAAAEAGTYYDPAVGFISAISYEAGSSSSALFKESEIILQDYELK